MKPLVAVLLMLAAAAAQAQSSGGTATRSAAPILRSAQPGMQLEKPAAAPRPAANLALTVTDDAESLMLPTMASRTVQQPTRLIRVGLEWKF